MMGYRYGYYMAPWGGFLWLICLIVIIVIALAIYKITTSGKGNTKNTINSDAKEILKQRNARGEIDEEQYRKMRDAMEK
jgi:putative membrane protein